MIDTHDPTDALDRLLALRPEDLDGWEADAASDDHEERELDALFGDMLAGWASQDLGEPDEDLILRRVAAADAPPATAPPATALRRPPMWLAAAACLLLGLAVWTQRPGAPNLKAVTDVETTRIVLQFAVERDLDGRVVVEPGRDGARLDGKDAVAMRFAIQGDGGYVSLFEASATSTQQLYPPRPTRFSAGTQRLQAENGDDLVYRPDAPGTYRYVAIVTDEPIDATMYLQDVLEAGEDRPDLWPRHVLSVDTFEATWSD